VNTRDGGECSVKVKAILASLVAKLPTKIDLGYCPTKEISQQQFMLDNVGEIPFDFEWSLENTKSMPFEIRPIRGSLDVNQSITMTVSFLPTEARYVIDYTFLISKVYFTLMQYVKFQEDNQRLFSYQVLENMLLSVPCSLKSISEKYT
jgi:hypothetical protein